VALYLGLDIGTTHITALALDVESGAILASQSVPNSTQTTSPADQARGRSEWDAQGMIELAWEAVRRVVASLPDPQAVRGIGLSGQMHGMCLLSTNLKPLTPFIGWQDRRGDDWMPGVKRTYLLRIIELADKLPRARMAAGFMGLTLFWLKETGFSFPAGARAAFISDALAAWLTGEPPCADPSNADSSGLFDAQTRRWNLALIERLGLPMEVLPPIRSAPAVAGWLRAERAQEVGLRAGLPVSVSVGDNQASFIGSVADYAHSLALNIGTGGQLSAYTAHYLRDEQLETRCFPGGGYILVSAGLCGGRSYAILRDFYRAVGVAFFGARGDEDLYERMNELAAGVRPGSDKVICEPLFAGTRHDPIHRASWQGLSANNFDPAHLTRSLLEGLARTFAGSYKRMLQIGVSERQTLIGSGNGIRRNRVLAEIAARQFNMPLHIPAHEEEAAYGAAILSAVSAGVFGPPSASLQSAGRLLRYQPPIPPRIRSTRRKSLKV
jgi:sugar (pentulose or hexulose) kinase